MKLVRASSFSSVIPSAKDSIPRIEDALARGTFSGKRQADKLTYVFVLRVRDAYFALTGRKGITFRDMIDHTTLDPKGGLAAGGLIALAKDIDREFGTKLLTLARLRRKEAEMGLSVEELKKLRQPWGKRTS